MVLLDMLFVDFSFLFSMQLTQVWKCVFISLTLIQLSGFNKKKKKKRAGITMLTAHRVYV